MTNICLIIIIIHLIDRYIQFVSPLFQCLQLFIPFPVDLTHSSWSLPCTQWKLAHISLYTFFLELSNKKKMGTKKKPILNNVAIFGFVNKCMRMQKHWWDHEMTIFDVQWCANFKSIEEKKSMHGKVYFSVYNSVCIVVTLVTGPSHKFKNRDIHTIVFRCSNHWWFIQAFYCHFIYHLVDRQCGCINFKYQFCEWIEKWSSQ